MSTMMAPDILARLRDVKRCGSGWKAQCPAHDDREASLKIDLAKDGRLLLKCFAGCSFDDILSAVPSCTPLRTRNGNSGAEYPPPWEWEQRGLLKDKYVYTDQTGAPLFEALRSVDKRFSQRRPDPHVRGRYQYSLKDVRRVLYRLPKVLEAVAQGTTVFVVEGEKDVHTLEAHGCTATTNAGGANSPWLNEYTEALRGAEVVIIPDNDAPGRQHADRVARALHRTAKSVVVLNLPGLPPKGDVTDWLTGGGSMDQLWRLLEDTPEYGPPTEPTAPDSELPQGNGDSNTKPTGTDALKSMLLTDVANARRLKEHHGSDIRHTTALGWLAWTGTHWARSEKKVRQKAQEIGKIIRLEVQERGITDPNLARDFFRWAQSSSSARGIDAMLKEAQALDGIDADTVNFDSNPWLLNCPNGTLDLRGGTFEPHNREHHITKLCPTRYQPDATCPRWHSFLRDIFLEDEDLVGYVQWAVGYALTGLVQHNAFFVCWGEGSNGKSTFLTTLQSVLGEDYAQQIDPETLMLQRHAQHPTELAALRGARLAVAIETAEGRRLNEALIKALTGGDKLRARFMHRDSFEFHPEMKLFLATNHRPVIRDTSRGMWRRIRLVPFEATFENDRKDPDLRGKLLQEREGILAWAVQGARHAAEEPPIPERVRVATEDYRQEQDLLGQFIEEECERSEFATVKKADLYRAYQTFTNQHCESQRSFCKRVRSRGFEEVRLTGGARAFKGIRLLHKDLDQTSDRSD